MATRLQKLTLSDFTGGLNIRQNSFQVADTETPEMLNVTVDARGGIVTRGGFRRWNSADLTLAADWDPRHGEPHTYADGTYAVYIANNGTILRGNSSGVFTDTLIPCNASPHLADFATWGDDMYIAVRRRAPVLQPRRRLRDGHPCRRQRVMEQRLHHPGRWVHAVSRRV